MGKPSVDVYDRFCKEYRRINEKIGLKQYLVPYLMSSHPGSRMEDAIELALFLKKEGLRPEQVQDFYPTPGTISTAMFYTELDPSEGNTDPLNYPDLVYQADSDTMYIVVHDYFAFMITLELTR